SPVVRFAITNGTTSPGVSPIALDSDPGGVVLLSIGVNSGCPVTDSTSVFAADWPTKTAFMVVPVASSTVVLPFKMGPGTLGSGGPGLVCPPAAYGLGAAPVASNAAPASAMLEFRNLMLSSARGLRWKARTKPPLGRTAITVPLAEAKINQ